MTHYLGAIRVATVTSTGVGAYSLMPVPAHTLEGTRVSETGVLEISVFHPPKKNRPGFYPGRSVACLCVEERRFSFYSMAWCPVSRPAFPNPSFL
jgi:hypothetical protein